MRMRVFFEKRIFVLAFLLSVFLLLNKVDAAIGVSPASYEIDFQPNLKQVFHFEFFSDNDYPFALYTQGDLSDYVELSKDKLEGFGGNVNVFLELPEDIELPGTHTILIGAKQKPNDQQGISLIGDIRGVIKVKVPYPGKYLTADLKSEGAKAGESVKFNLNIQNLGKEDVTASPYITIFDSYNKTAATIKLEDQLIPTTESKEIIAHWDTTPEQAGLYTAKANVDYGGKNPATSEFKFRLGELYFNILNNSEVFERNKINRFDVDVESYWNDPIDNVFVEVSITLYSISFLTPSTSFKSFEKKTLTGYFDTSSISKDVDEFKAKIKVQFEGKSTEKIVTLRFRKEINYTLYAIIAAIVIALIILIALIIWLIRIKKSKRKRVK